MIAEAPEAVKVRQLAKEYGIEKTRFRERKEKRNKKCIMCGLCVRVCHDVMGFGAIGFERRGYRREITPPFETYSDVCTTCGACAFVCPTEAIDLRTLSDKKIRPISSEFDRSLITRPCVYTPFPQAVPNVPVIDKENCVYFKTGNCRICEKVCGPQAVDYEQKDQVIEEDVGAVVVATGFDTLPVTEMGEYGYGKYPDVVDGLAFERLLSASGPTGGVVRRPSDGKVPKEVVFVQCAGSRDPEKYCPHCSKICCMYTAKHALLYKHRVHDGQPYIFYIDVRTAGKSYEEFYHRVSEEEGVPYIRGKVSKVFQDGDKLMVWGVDTLTGKKVEIAADMVVLATAMVPSQESQKLFSTLKLASDENGFLSEAHPKLRPVESIIAGFFLAGAAQGPRDIPETVAQAGGAASKVIGLFSQDKLYHEPIVAVVEEDLCSGCKVCISVCPYDAREFDEEKSIVKVNDLLCEGCGACVVSCPSGATQQRNLTDDQIRQMVKAVLGGE
jgi:heterodisulfide reductase subunit A